MPVILTADPPSPVGLWDITVPGKTRIDWSTDSTAIRARLQLSVDGGTPVQVAGGAQGEVTGSYTYEDVRLGREHLFILRRAGSNAVLATLSVRAYDLQQELLAQTVGAILLGNKLDPPQAIHSLVIEPGIDTVRLRFRTRNPTIPHVAVETEDGEQVVSWFPLLGGLQTLHVAELGLDRPLAQDTAHRLRITVPSGALLGPKDIVRKAAFRTGIRHVNVRYDHLKVLRDGDPWPWGAGELEFIFAACDASSWNGLVTSGPLRRDIDQNDPPIPLRRNTPLLDGPRTVWIYVQGQEHDPEPPTAGLGIDVVSWPLGVTGTGPIDKALWEGAWVARSFAISDLKLGQRTIPFELQTGDFGVAFSVWGRIEVEAKPGRGWWDVPVGRRFPSKMAVLKAPGAKAVMSGEGGAGAALVLGADGMIWLRPIDPEHPGPRDEGWSALAPAPGGAVTGLRLKDGRVEAFGLDRGGGALRWQPGEGAWRPLGQRLVPPLLAVEGPAGQVLLLGLGEDGRVLQRSLGPGIREEGLWEDLGGDIAGDLLVVETARGGPALLAIGRGGRILCRQLHHGAEWWPLGGPQAAWLAAVPVGEGALIVALTQERILHRLLWRKLPDPEPGKAWEELGPLDDLPMLPLPIGRSGEEGIAAEQAEAAAVTLSAELPARPPRPGPPRDEPARDPGPGTRAPSAPHLGGG